MQVLATIAIVFAGTAVIAQLVGVFIALISSFMAMIAFRTKTTLSAAAFGLNIVNTAFLSVGTFVLTADVADNPTSASAIDMIAVYTGIHVFLLVVSIAYKLLMDRRVKRPAE